MGAAKGFRKVALATVVVVALCASAGVGAWAQSGDPNGGGGGVPELRAGAASPTESELVPITPCRIVNTATSGAGRLAPGEVRAYRSQGNTTAQGGAASCGIPATASALEVNITAPLALGSGFLRVAPAGVAIPNATFLNYTAGLNLSNAGTIGVAKGTGNNFQVQAFTAGTHVVVDVLGYYVEGLMARVNANGTLAIGNGVLSAQKRAGAPGYEVTFDRNVAGCTFTATLNDNQLGVDATSGEVQVGPIVRSVGSVYVLTRNNAGGIADRPFNLQVSC